ncbi:DUF5719 family protein [Arthrobacter sp. JSM 101049]|uniref:DUF5719 family protein n=1 Tax=Arthrobacter sp. JSM 101049 TaxID=929097 RepID=UPI003569BF0C
MKRTRTRGRGRAASVSLGALLIVATAAGTTAASLAGPLPTPEAVPVPQVTVPASDFIAQCPATARLVKGAAGQGTDPAFAPDSDSAKTAVRATVLSDAAERLPGAELEKPDGSSVRTLAERLPEEKAAEVKSTNDSGFTGRRAAAASGISEPGPVALRVQPLGGQQSTADAVRSYVAGDGDLAGLAAARCQVPSNQQWLTGASTTVGSMALLTLANPSETPSTVDLELFGAQGRIEAGNTRGIVIAPGESTSIVLGGLASGEESLTVKATSTGAPVTAIIQQSILRGLTPGGVDFIAPSAAPGERQVVPGVLVQDAKTQKDIAGQDGYEDAVPTLSLTVPGTAEQRVKVRLVGEKGEVSLPSDGQYTVAGGATLAVPLTGVPGGTYTAVVDAEEPVAASVRTTRGTKAGERTDAAWTGSAQRLGGEHLVAVPQGAESRLVFAAPEGEGSVEVRPVNAKGSVGKPVTVTVESGRSVERTIASLGKDVVAVALSASGDAVYGSMLSTQGKTGVSSLGLPPATQGPRTVPVDLRY